MSNQEQFSVISDWIDYREKLGVGFCDEEQTNYFISQVCNELYDFLEERKTNHKEYGVIFSGILDYDAISEEEYSEFCKITGTRKKSTLFTVPIQEIQSVLENHSFDLFDFLSYFVAIINSLTDREKGIKKAELLQIVDIAFSRSRLKYDLLKDGDKYFIFPGGAKELDDALVSQPLEWLKEYPKTYKTYIIALKQFAEGIYVRDVADNLRKTLESFLQEYLGNSKNLETNKNEICRYLGEQNVDPGIVGLFQPLINAYKNINDRIAKHNDAVDEKLLEFLLYQTGILIRMVITVH